MFYKNKQVSGDFKKIRAYLENYLQTFFYYRPQVFLWSVIDMAPLVVLIIVWQAVFQNQDKVAGLSFEQMFSWYVLLSLVRQFLTTGSGKNVITQEIYTGQLSFHLLKPFSYLKRIFTEEVSWRSLQTLLFLPLFFLFLKIFNQSLSLNLSFFKLIALMLIFTFSFLISAFLDYLCGVAAFWLVQTTTLFHLRDIFYWLLGGLAFPPSLLPLWLQKINLGLPFYYVFAFPLQVLTQEVTFFDLGIRVLIQGGWAFILFFLYKLLWKKGLFSYAAWGN